MKITKIIIFIFSIFIALGIIAFSFPKSGIKIGKIELLFPSIEDVFFHDTLKNKNMSDILSAMEEIQLNEELLRQESLVKDSIIQTIIDSIRFYEKRILLHPTKLYLPENNIHFFDSLFGEMDNCKTNSKVIRVLHYGDSQIETDRITSSIRTFFQERFGGGGPGMIPLVQPIPTSSVAQRISGNHINEYAVYGNAARTDDNNYGVMTKFYRVNGEVNLVMSPSSFKNVDPRIKEMSSVSVLYENFDELSITLSDRKNKFYSTKTDNNNQLSLFSWHIDSTSSFLNLEINGYADIFGIMLDNGSGVAVDNIPMRGSSGTVFSKINKNKLQTMFDLCNIGMVILQFGGNFVPSLAGQASIEYYCNLIATQIQYFKKINPNVKIIFIGPADMNTKIDGKMQTYPLLPAMIKSLCKTVTENGAAFWNMYDAMGGENSMITWVENGYGETDHIHFSPQGAGVIGKSFVNTMKTFYELYQYKQNVSNHLYLEAQNIISNFNDSTLHINCSDTQNEY